MGQLALSCDALLFRYRLFTQLYSAAVKRRAKRGCTVADLQSALDLDLDAAARMHGLRTKKFTECVVSFYPSV